MMVSEGQTLQGRYRVEGLIGQGGMSYVYRAFDQKLDRMVAIKVLKSEYCEDAEFIQKFQNEARAAARLNHPNIVAAYDVVDEGKLHFIVMELVEGITLKNYIRRKGRLDNKEAVGIALQVLDGIAQAHKLGIVHRDIKPQNMIVGEDGVVKVADFGVARAATQQTVNATVMGSVHYISPEQARSGLADARSDIYSFGCTLFEMLTGKVPFDGENAVGVVLSHVETPPPHVRDLAPEVYPALDQIVWRCMQKRPEKRYKNIEELGEDLRLALSNPNGFSENDEEETDGDAAESRMLTACDTEQMRQRTQTRADQAIEEFVRESGVPEDEVGDQIGRVYKLIAGGCVVVIILLAAVIGGKLLGFFRVSNVPSETETQQQTTAALGTSVQDKNDAVNITISALDEKLPNIIGKTVAEAEDYLADYQVRFRTVQEAFSDNYPTAGVIVSYPVGKYQNGDIVDVTLSKGAATIDLSDEETLHRTTLVDLAEQLKLRNVAFETKLVYSDEVEKGYIVSASKQSTAGSGELLLTVSRGKQRVAVPDLLNRTEADARAALQNAGFSVGAVTYEASGDVAEGVVMSQQYAQGVQLERGTSVSFVVSGGAEGKSDALLSAAAETTTGSSAGAQTHWYSNVRESVVVGQGGPGATGTVLVSIRLKQWVDNAWKYTELQGPRSYAAGTEVQVVFGNIVGAAGVETGQVEVVDASSDTVIASFGCKFGPAG